MSDRHGMDIPWSGSLRVSVAVGLEYGANSPFRHVL